MSIKQLILSCALVFTAFSPSVTLAVEPSEPSTYSLAKITALETTQEADDTFFGEVIQKITFEIIKGPETGQSHTVDYASTSADAANIQFSVGTKVVIQKTTGPLGDSYAVVDRYRLPGIAWLLLIFVALVLFFGRIRGLSSIFGLAISLSVLGLWVVPQILSGHDPIRTSLVASFAIAILSILFGHGFNRRSFLSLASTLITLIGAFALAALAIKLTHLTGSSSEEAVLLQLGFLPSLNLQGLLFGGLVFGALGVLDDVTTAQTATVAELSAANQSFLFSDLYRRAISVGKEHIASLVNTLALAYVGASFPLFLLFFLPGSPPTWVIFNGEYIIEEVVRALVGGSALVLAVPISTLIAAFYYRKTKSV